MRIKIEFDSDKDSDFNNYKTYLKSIDMKMAIWDISQLLRRETKHVPDSMSTETYNELTKIKNSINEIISNYDLDEILNN